MKNSMIGRKVIARGKNSGVLFGTLVEQEGQVVALENARKIYYWDGACAIEQIAKDGVTNPRSCKITVSVDESTMLDCNQLIPCTEKASKCIESVSVWKS